MKLGVMVASGVAMVAFATGAATSQTQAEMVTGVWNCSSQTPGGLVAGQMTYKADGTTQSVLTLTADIDGGKLEAQLDATSTWQLLGGGLIREQITSITARSAKLDGEDLPEKSHEIVKAGIALVAVVIGWKYWQKNRFERLAAMQHMDMDAFTQALAGPPGRRWLARHAR